MALIPKFHVVASDHGVAPYVTGTTFNTIAEGMIVMLSNAQGGVVPYVPALTTYPIGIAGDTKSQSGSTMPGVYTGWQNRVSDGFDETKASTLITVYHSGGEFITDQFDAAVLNSNVGAPLYAGANGQLFASAQNSDTKVVAILTRAAGPYPSGVPGTDLELASQAPYQGDMALQGSNYGGTVVNQYIEIKLLV
jgi:hypothetical protein